MLIQFLGITEKVKILRGRQTSMEYLVTTKKDVIPTDRQIVMLDGSVPGWQKRDKDLHYDHHQNGGALVQIDEIPKSIRKKIDADAVFTTTQIDADACVAAAWCQTAEEVDADNLRKLRSIAFDCDYLAVPQELGDLADFAAQAVATLKVVGKALRKKLSSHQSKETWASEHKRIFSSLVFKTETEWLILASKGWCKYPGENGEAKDYWAQVEKDTKMLVASNRISYYRGAAIINYRGLGRQYIDPRSATRAISADWQAGKHLLPITLSVREVWIKKKYVGLSYTIGNFPSHPDLKDLDYLASGTFEALTLAEKDTDVDCEEWGGRKTLGGSSWNKVSNLHPEEVIDIALSKCFKR